MSDRVTVYSKVDIKSLAIVGKFLAQEGIRPKGQSDLTNQAVKILANHLVKTGLVEPTANKQKAIKELRDIGITWSRGSRGRKEIEKNLGGKPDVNVGDNAPRTDSGGLDINQLQEEAEEIHKKVGNQGGGTEGEVAPPDPSQQNDD